MEIILPTILVTILVLGLSIVGMSFKVFLKNEDFKGGCASNNPMLRDKVGACGVCGKTDFNDKVEVSKVKTTELPLIG